MRLSSSTRVLILAGATAVIAAACIKVPYTGRRQFNLVPDSIMNGLGADTYTTMLQGQPLRTDGRDATILTRVGQRIAQVAHKPKYDWQFRLIEEDTLNAWCLPGGKIGFYTGILPVLKNEAGMAFVMGHEVGHATARHGSERLSQNLAMVGGLSVLDAYLAGEAKLSDQQRGLVLGALGVGAQVGVMLPFSRKHESEADVIGLMYMASAGYPPEESIVVWDRMGAAAKGPRPPAFLSTHPTNAKRQEVLRDWMDLATKRYQRHRLAGDMQATIWDGSDLGATSGGTSGKTSTGTKTPSGDSSGGSSSGGTTEKPGSNR